MPSVVTATDTCIYVPVRWDLSGIPVGYSWTIDLTADTDDGIYGYGTGPSSGADEFLWCDDNLAGKHHVSGAIEITDTDYATTTDVIDLTYTVIKMATKVTLRATRKAPKIRQKLNLKGCITANGKRQDGRQAAIEYQWPGKAWKRLMYTYTDSVGCYVEPINIRDPGTVKMRIRVPGDSISTAGYSKAIKIKAHK